MRLTKQTKALPYRLSAAVNRERHTNKSPALRRGFVVRSCERLAILVLLAALLLAALLATLAGLVLLLLLAALLAAALLTALLATLLLLLLLLLILVLILGHRHLHGSARRDAYKENAMSPRWFRDVCGWNLRDNLLRLADWGR